jgi:hypothetical protein
MREKLSHFKGLLAFAAILNGLLALELGLHVFSFYSHVGFGLSAVLVALATAVAAGSVPAAAFYSEMLDGKYAGRSVDDRLFKGLLSQAIVMFVASVLVALLLMTVATFQLMAVFNIAKDVGLYLIWLYLWANGSMLFIWWVSRARSRIPERVAFSVPLSLAGVTVLAMLMSFFLDISHLSSFTGITQNILALHIYVRMLLMIAGTLFLFGWVMMWLMRLYRRE